MSNCDRCGESGPHLCKGSRSADELAFDYPHAFEDGACVECALCDLADLPCGCDICWRCLENQAGEEPIRCPSCMEHVDVNFESGVVKFLFPIERLIP